MKLKGILFFFIWQICQIGYSQIDTISLTNHSTSYFFQRNALSMPKGSFSYNNYYLLINTINYQVTNRLSIGAGICITPFDVFAPPSYVQAQYSLPIAKKLSAAASLTYYQISYKPMKNGALLVPQLLFTLGDKRSNGTIGACVLRGNFSFENTNGFPVRLPNRINLISSFSYNRHIVDNFHLISQNHYIKTEGIFSQNYSQIWFLSLGGRVDLKKSTIKFGLVNLHYPESSRVRFSKMYPFVGYSLLFR